MAENGLAVLSILSRHWFPGRKVDEDSMAEALFLEQDHWRKMSVAVANGIVIAFKG